MKVKAIQKAFYGMKRVNVGDELDIPEKDFNELVFEKLVPEVVYVAEKSKAKVKHKDIDEDVI